jgi:acyl-CoA synthetase (AMP-forming)/AMP-acid ligase II
VTGVPTSSGASFDELGDLVEISALTAIGLQARYRGAKVAIVDARESVNYADIWARARKAAVAFAALGARRGDRVAFALEPSADYVAAILGAQMLGAVSVPLNTRLTPPEIAEFLAPIEASHVIASEEFRQVVSSDEHGRTAQRVEFGGTHASVVSTGVKGSPLPPGAALILGTGGTTGTPKGAVYTHEGLFRWTLGAAVHNQVRSNDVELFVAPFFHGTLVTGLLTSLTQGATVVVLDRFDVDVAIEQIASGRITRMLGAAPVVSRLVSAAAGVDMSGSALRYIQFGMGSSRGGFANEIRAAFPGTDVITGYGATEFGPVTRTYSWEFDSGGDPIGVGRPVIGADIVIETNDVLHSTPNVEGELLVRSPWQMARYCVADSELNAQSRRGRYFRSGDIGQFDEGGNVLLTGRLKDTIRTGGENVYPTEVEAALYRHAGVAECAVYGVSDPEWGERVEAAVVPSGLVTQDELVTHLRKALAGFKIPKRIRMLDTLPQTSASKIDRRGLRRTAESEQ